LWRCGVLLEHPRRSGSRSAAPWPKPRVSDGRTTGSPRRGRRRQRFSDRLWGCVAVARDLPVNRCPTDPRRECVAETFAQLPSASRMASVADLAGGVGRRDPNHWSVWHPILLGPEFLSRENRSGPAGSSSIGVLCDGVARRARFREFATERRKVASASPTTTCRPAGGEAMAHVDRPDIGRNLTIAVSTISNKRFPCTNNPRPAPSPPSPRGGGGSYSSQSSSVCVPPARAAEDRPQQEVALLTATPPPGSAVR